MKILVKLFGLLFYLSIIGCTVTSDDDDMEPESMIPELTVKAKVDKVYSRLSCEGDGTSGKGDLYTKIIIRANSNPGLAPQPLIETEEVEIEVAQYETVTDTNVSAETSITPFNGMRLEIIVLTREGDPGGTTQISRSFIERLVYDENNGCWFELTGTDCAAGAIAGTSTMNKAKEDSMTGGNCDMEFDWSFEITRQ